MRYFDLIFLILKLKIKQYLTTYEDNKSVFKH